MTTKVKRRSAASQAKALAGFSDGCFDSNPAPSLQSDAAFLLQLKEEIQKNKQDAVVKAQAIRDAAAERKQELKSGEVFCEMLKYASGRQDPETLGQFWEEVKVRSLKHLGSLDKVTQYVDAGDGIVSYQRICDLFRLIHIPLSQIVSRALYQQVSGIERHIPVDNFKALLMGRTIRVMRTIMAGFSDRQARVQSHIATVLRQLCESNESNLNATIDRFQRKLSVAFIKRVWKAMLKDLGKSRTDDITLTRNVFQQLIQDTRQTLQLQEYEVIYMMRIYDLINEHKSTLGLFINQHITAGHVITALVLLSLESDKKLKIAMIFEVFDSDYDNCLMYKQIHSLCKVMTAVRSILEDHSGSAIELDFQSGLAEQEGQRVYECLHWDLHNTLKVQGDVINMPEFWQALTLQEKSADLLLPGVLRMRWVGKASSSEVEEKDPRIFSTASKAASMQHLVRRNSGLTTHGTTGMPKDSRTGKRSETGKDLKQAGSRSKGDSFISLDSMTSDLTMEGTSVGSKFFRQEVIHFKKSVLQRFNNSLKERGDDRLVELRNGFRADAQASQEDFDSVVDPLKRSQSQLSPTSLRSLAGLFHSSSPEARPASSGGQMQATRQRITTGERTFSEPVLMRPSTQSGSQRTSAHAWQGSSFDGTSPRSATGGERPSTAELPYLQHIRWGGEAADRFRMTAAAYVGDCPVARQQSKAGKRPDVSQPQSYRCQLCHGIHKIHPGHEV